MHTKNVDYHIHYHLDSCTADEMTLDNIDTYAARLGLEEITILKHYSHALPNKGEHWVHWHRIIPKDFETFLEDAKGFKSKHGISIRTGVETELINDKGDINIPLEQQERLDMVALSMHHMIDMEGFPMDAEFSPMCTDESVLAAWDRKASAFGTESFVKGIVQANIMAIKRFPKVRTLSHFADGLYMLRQYRVPIESIPEETLIRLMEPLMHVMAENNVLWELAVDNIPCTGIAKRADELGVRFSATADAHTLEDYSRLCILRHNLAQNLIDELGLHNGVIKF